MSLCIRCEMNETSITSEDTSEKITKELQALRLLRSEMVSRIQGMEQRLDKWDTLIDSYIGNSIEKLLGQADSMESRLNSLQRFSVATELNLYFLWVLRYLMDKTKIRNPKVKYTVDFTLADIKTLASNCQQKIFI